MDKLGVELPLLLTQIVNFSIMFLILTKFLYRPILKALKDRKEKIEEGLRASQKAQEEAEKMHKKKEELVTEAREEARSIIEEAKKAGKQLKDELVKEGKEDLLHLKLKQEKELEQQKKTLEVEVGQHTVEIAGEMVRRLLGQVLSEKDQRQLIEVELKRLKKIHHEQKK